MGDSPPVVLKQVLGPESLAASIRNVSLEACQLSSRPLPSRLARVICPTTCLDLISLGPAMLFSGTMPRDCYTLVFVTDCRQKGRSFNFEVEHNDGYMGFFPPGGELDAYTPEGYANAALAVPAAVFEDAVSKLFPEIPEPILNRGAGMRIGAAEQARLRGLLDAITRAINDTSGPLAGVEARSRLEAELLDTFLCALRMGCGSLVPKPGRRIEGRLARLKRARDYLSIHLQEPLALADLCGELGMSRRGVEVLFQDSLGIGPNAFLRHQRLHGARRALQDATRGAGVVKQTALAWGFWHMGHFAREYREVFGECPSETLVRRETR